MAGHGQKLARKQESAIAFLLSEPTIEQAAEKVGISKHTLKIWLARPDFSSAYSAARRQVLSDAVTKLQKAASQAVDTLVRNLTCGIAAPEIRAAEIVLEQANKGVELLDLAARIEELEDIAKSRGNGVGFGQARGEFSYGAFQAGGKPDTGSHSARPGVSAENGRDESGCLAERIDTLEFPPRADAL